MKKFRLPFPSSVTYTFAKWCTHAYNSDEAIPFSVSLPDIPSIGYFPPLYILKHATLRDLCPPVRREGDKDEEGTKRDTSATIAFGRLKKGRLLVMATSNEPPGMPAQARQPVASQRTPGGLATWTIVVILIVVLGVGVLGGWLLGRNTSAAGVASSSPQAGVDQDALRVNVIAKFRPSVVQINVSTQNGQGGAGFGNDHR